MADLITVSRAQINTIQGALFLGILGIPILVSLDVLSKTQLTMLLVRNLTSL